ncbi:MAG: DUF4924 family protein [Rikenellaceae bacterium]|nr:DUF4924 family protein [Rikenellaceae bacterium]
MLIARQKRKENIAEYIIYLWQLEDILRALKFSPEAVYSQLVEKQQISDQEKMDVFFWYQDMINLLRSEGKEEHGHLDHTLHLVKDLNELHESLLKVPAGEEYRRIFAPLAAELPQIRSRMDKIDMSDIELCLRALYAVILYRIKGDEEHKTFVDDTLALISPVIAQLSKIHKEIEEGKFDLYKNIEQK